MSMIKLARELANNRTVKDTALMKYMNKPTGILLNADEKTAMGSAAYIVNNTLI